MKKMIHTIVLTLATVFATGTMAGPPDPDNYDSAKEYMRAMQMYQSGGSKDTALTHANGNVVVYPFQDCESPKGDFKTRATVNGTESCYTERGSWVYVRAPSGEVIQLHNTNFFKM